jgi:hypothetical protein
LAGAAHSDACIASLLRKGSADGIESRDQVFASQSSAIRLAWNRSA